MKDQCTSEHWISASNPGTTGQGPSAPSGKSAPVGAIVGEPTVPYAEVQAHMRSEGASTRGASPLHACDW